jgi:CYTH domain-containing protein
MKLKEHKIDKYFHVIQHAGVLKSEWNANVQFGRLILLVVAEIENQQINI